jgi:hypothetical protein
MVEGGTRKEQQAWLHAPLRQPPRAFYLPGREGIGYLQSLF